VRVSTTSSELSKDEDALSDIDVLQRLLLSVLCRSNRGNVPLTMFPDSVFAGVTLGFFAR
jgi:hypothetical protein